MGIEQTAASITNMIVHGTGKIARAAVIALSDSASNYDSIDRNSFIADLEKAKKVLLNFMLTATSHREPVNKMGTSELAIISNEFKVRFYARRETYKFLSMTMLDRKAIIKERYVNEIITKEIIPDPAKTFNLLFVRILARYVNVIITELRLISSSPVYGLIAKQIEDKMFQKVN